MIAVRRAESDADLEAWRRVRIAVVPNERAQTVDELREALTPTQLYLLAELDGRVAGSGVAGRSDLAGQGFLSPRVLPEARRRGVGTALLRELAEHVQRHGFDRAGAMLDDTASLAFVERFGFREVDRDVEQVRAIGDEAWPEPPPGIEVVSLAERPELFERAYHELALEAFRDFPLDRPIEISLEDWNREWQLWPEGSFFALADGELVGMAGLIRDDDRPGRAENSLSAVRRDWRRRGVASLLKRTVLAWAAANGLQEVYTWTQNGNAAMRVVNERLGYETRSVAIRVRGRLPLPR
ncbi:MAG TPA: GNAT family N-acetyltransferase [Gaiellaceae bacterium]|nr:GNAT family N-acetyltransferase [Gaiellaceae bacterium]